MGTAFSPLKRGTPSLVLFSALLFVLAQLPLLHSTLHSSPGTIISWQCVNDITRLYSCSASASSFSGTGVSNETFPSNSFLKNITGSSSTSSFFFPSAVISLTNLWEVPAMVFWVDTRGQEHARYAIGSQCTRQFFALVGSAWRIRRTHDSNHLGEASPACSSSTPSSSSSSSCSSSSSSSTSASAEDETLRNPNASSSKFISSKFATWIPRSQATTSWRSTSSASTLDIAVEFFVTPPFNSSSYSSQKNHHHHHNHQNSDNDNSKDIHENACFEVDTHIANIVYEQDRLRRRNHNVQHHKAPSYSYEQQHFHLYLSGGRLCPAGTPPGSTRPLLREKRQVAPRPLSKPNRKPPKPSPSSAAPPPPKLIFGGVPQGPPPSEILPEFHLQMDLFYQRGNRRMNKSNEGGTENFDDADHNEKEEDISTNEVSASKEDDHDVSVEEVLNEWKRAHQQHTGRNKPSSGTNSGNDKSNHDDDENDEENNPKLAKKRASFELHHKRVVGSHPDNPHDGLVMRIQGSANDLLRPRSISATFPRSEKCPFCNYPIDEGHPTQDDDEEKKKKNASCFRKHETNSTTGATVEEHCSFSKHASGNATAPLPIIPVETIDPSERLPLVPCPHCGGEGYVHVSCDHLPYSSGLIPEGKNKQPPPTTTTNPKFSLGGYSYAKQLTKVTCSVCLGTGTTVNQSYWTTSPAHNPQTNPYDACPHCIGQRYTVPDRKWSMIFPAGVSSIWTARHEGEGGVTQGLLPGPLIIHLDTDISGSLHAYADTQGIYGDGSGRSNYDDGGGTGMGGAFGGGGGGGGGRDGITRLLNITRVSISPLFAYLHGKNVTRNAVAGNYTETTNSTDGEKDAQSGPGSSILLGSLAAITGRSSLLGTSTTASESIDKNKNNNTTASHNTTPSSSLSSSSSSSPSSINGTSNSTSTSQSMSSVSRAAAALLELLPPSSALLADPTGPHLRMNLTLTLDQAVEGVVINIVALRDRIITLEPARKPYFPGDVLVVPGGGLPLHAPIVPCTWETPCNDNIEENVESSLPEWARSCDPTIIGESCDAQFRSTWASAYASYSMCASGTSLPGLIDLRTALVAQAQRKGLMLPLQLLNELREGEPDQSSFASGENDDGEEENKFNPKPGEEHNRTSSSSSSQSKRKRKQKTRSPKMHVVCAPPADAAVRAYPHGHLFLVIDVDVTSNLAYAWALSEAANQQQQRQEQFHSSSFSPPPPPPPLPDAAELIQSMYTRARARARERRRRELAELLRASSSTSSNATLNINQIVTEEKIELEASQENDHDDDEEEEAGENHVEGENPQRLDESVERMIGHDGSAPSSQDAVQLSSTHHHRKRGGASTRHRKSRDNAQELDAFLTLGPKGENRKQTKQ